MLQAKVPVWVVYAFIAYFFAFMFMTLALLFWQAKRRKERPPEKFKLLRAPGETLRRRVQQADENLFWYGLVGAFVPLVFGWLVLLVAVRLPKNLVLPIAGVAILVFIGSLVATTARLLHFMRRRRNDFLGYLGERAVAESLDALRGQGYHIFHDVPADGQRSDFNLDHIVVGPTGVTVVETKTRRKRSNCQNGREEHVVTFDGRHLTWPWGEDRCGCDQSVANADWLRKWLKKQIDLHVDPKPVVAFPGWFVTERAIGAWRVANPKMLPGIVTQWKPQPLSPEQIDLIRRQLDSLCRDVED